MDNKISTNGFALNGNHNGHSVIKRRIKYENELDPKFSEKIADVAHGEAMYNCIQCGTCSATCPVSHYMDYTPRKIIAMVREGFKEEVLRSSTVWLCASCYSCTVECPKSIKITDVMYALKREAITGGYAPEKFPTPALAESFFKQVKLNGRNSEGPLMMDVYMKTGIFKAFSNVKMAFKLWKNGRLSMKSEKIANRKDISKLLDSIEKVKEVDKK